MTSTALAIDGGKPVRDSYLPYGRQSVDEDDIAAVADVLRGDWLTTGPMIGQFEEAVASYCGTRFAVAVANGTAALHAACAVAGLSPGDEAITTPLTFVATANAVVYCGAKPVLADIRSDTLNIDPKEIISKITPNTKAILPVDFGGLPSDMTEILDIAKQYNLIVISDGAHSLGAKYKGRPAASLSDMTILSFHPVKHITTGEGGMILTNSPHYYEAIKILRHHGMIRNPQQFQRNDGPWYHEIGSLGYNFRITDIQCALGLSQLRKLDYFVQRRRDIAAQYSKVFSQFPEIRLPTEPKEFESSYHIYTIQLCLDKINWSRRKAFEALRAENIGVNVHYIPVHLHPYYQKTFGYRRGDFPLSEEYYDTALTLPIFPRMTEEDVLDVVTAVTKIVNHAKK